MSLVVVGTCGGVVGLSHLVQQRLVAVSRVFSLFNVGFCSGVVGWSHFVLQPVVSVR